MATKILMKTLVLGLAASAAASAAEPPSAMVTWAGCAGALVAKTLLLEDKSQAPKLQAMARRALAHAKTVDNPEKQTPGQIDGLAMSTARSYLDEAKKSPEQRAKLESLAEGCAGLVAKLPD
jgi:hypothetical protein